MSVEKIMELLQRGLHEGIYPSGVLAIGDREGERFRYVIGDASEESLYDIASLTKIVSTTMITFQFIQEGLLSLHDKLSDFFESLSESLGQITIQDLMTHQSGFAAFYDLPSLCQHPDDVLPVIFHQGLSYPTKTDVVYSCNGYIVLGKILEKVSNQSLEQLFNLYVAEPLNLTQTGYQIKSPHLVKTAKNLERGMVHDPNARFQFGVSGNAGLFSNIDDLSAFTRMLANHGQIKDQVYVHHQLFEAALKNYSPSGCEARGLGFSLKGEGACSCGDLFNDGSYGHTGFTGTSLWVDEKSGLYVVFLSNRVYEGDDNLKIIRFRRLLHNVIMMKMMNEGE